MTICEEPTWIRNDLFDVEPIRIITSLRVQSTNFERPSQTAIRNTTVVRSFRIGESKARWACLAFDCFVNVCSRKSRRCILASNTGQGDIVTNSVFRDVNSIFEDTLGTRLAWLWCAIGSDDLIWGCLDVVLGIEVEEFLIFLPLITFPLVLPVFFTVLVVFIFVVSMLTVINWSSCLYIWKVSSCLGSSSYKGLIYHKGSAQDGEQCRSCEMHGRF